MSAGVLRPDLIIRSTWLSPHSSTKTGHLTRMLPDCTPAVMAAILSIYGLVIAVIISNGMQEQTHLFTGFVHLGAGLAVGVSALSAGFAIGITGDAGVRGSSQQPRLFIGMMLLQIMSEVLGMSISLRDVRSCLLIFLGLYGMVVAMMMLTKTSGVTCGND